MINNFQKLLYRLTCVAPMMLVCGLIIWIQKSNIWLSLLLFCGGGILCIYAIIFINLCNRSVEILSIEVETITKNDLSLYMYFATYIVPLLGLKEEKSWYVVGGIGIAMTILSFFVHQLPLSPILILVGYRFYKIQISSGLGECYLLSKAKQMRDSNQIKYVKRVDDGLYIHWEE